MVLISMLGVLLLVGGLYVMTQNAPMWQQVELVIVQMAAPIPLSIWQRVEYFGAIGAMTVGASLVLLRLFGGLKRV